MSPVLCSVRETLDQEALSGMGHLANEVPAMRHPRRTSLNEALAGLVQAKVRFDLSGQLRPPARLGG